MTTLTHYLKIKDNYCIAYFGPNKEYVLQALHFKSAIEESLPGIKIYIYCREEMRGLLPIEPFILYRTDKADKAKFNYFRELSCDGVNHPIWEILSEMKFNSVLKITPAPPSKKCVIITRGTLPTKNLSAEVITKLKSHCSKLGYDTFIDTSVEDAGWVVGVESYDLFKAAGSGVRTSLVPTGLGTKLYSCYPNSEILHLEKL